LGIGLQEAEETSNLNFERQPCHRLPTVQGSNSDVQFKGSCLFRMWPALTIVVASLGRLAFLVASDFAVLRNPPRDRSDQSAAASRARTADPTRRHFQQHAGGPVVARQTGRIQMANRAFAELFAADDVRGKLLLEAVRWHEVAELVTGSDRSKPGLRAGEISRPERTWLQVSAALISNGRRATGTLLVFHG
jgi:hypothetical protein